MRGVVSGEHVCFATMSKGGAVGLLPKNKVAGLLPKKQGDGLGRCSSMGMGTETGSRLHEQA